MDLKHFKARYEHVKVQEHQNNVSENPMVSICVQTYQHVNFIEACLEGILNQKINFQFEILLGEDSSTDGTREICIEYANKYPERIRLFLHHRENNIYIGGKPSGRFNFMFNLLSARGKYIALCEGDDYWTDPLKLQKQVDFLEANPEYSLVVGGFKQIDVDTGKEEVVIKDIPESDEKGFDIDLEIFLRGWYTKTLTLMFRKDFFDVEEFRKYKYSRDVHLNYILLKKGLGYYMKEVFGVYHRHGGGVFSAISEIKKINDGYLIFEELNKVNSHDLLIKNKFIKQREKVLKKKSFREDNRIRVFRLLYDQLMTSSDFKSFKKNTKYILQALNLWK